MTDKKILTIQDISCVGQCSLTVALPIISCCGHETCVLPSAVLSTHTAGFKGYTFHDLASDMPAISRHWQSENITFDAIYTGYLGSTEQIEYIKEIVQNTLSTDGKFVVDPAMGDNGKLYPAFDSEYVAEMKTLCAKADIIIPNITEACYLTNVDYKTEYDMPYVEALIYKLASLGSKTVILTGVRFCDSTTGVMVYEDGQMKYYEHRLISKGCHGTGDVYASVFVGSLLAGKSTYDAAKLAADFTVACIEYTQKDPNHWYGVKFEKCLSMLVDELNR